MKFLSDILAKAGLTVDGVVTLNNTATGQTPASNDNSTKLATTAWVRTFVQPYSLPIASTSILGGIKVGTGLSIDAGSGILSVTGGGAASIKSTQTFTATGGQTVFTITGGYIVGLIDVFLNGVYLSPNQTTATNGTSITLSDAALAGDIIDVIIASPVYQGATTTTDQLSEGTTNLYFTNARARAAISETVTGLDYNSSTGVLSITTGYGIPTTASQTTWDAAYNDKINSAAVTGTTTKTLTLTQQDGGTVTATWTDINTDAVTSVFGRTGVVVAVSGDYTTTLVTEGTNLYYTDARARAAISVTGSGSYNSATGVITVTGGVTSVNTLTGAVVLTTTNITEGTNLYYTQARFDTAFTAKSTTNLAEGTNLYYTSARANADFDTRLATKSTTNLSEGTNLYYTDARVGTYLTANSYATQTYVGTQIANLVAAAPATLDTLNELAAALGNDPSFATTVSTSIGTKVPQTRTITINGTTFDLSANRTYTINSMVYPGAGIALSTGSAWGTSITDNSANWNTAFGWGNHASGGYLTSATAATTYASLTGAYANPAFVVSLAYSKITGVPAFITSYTEVDTLASVTGRGATTTAAITVTASEGREVAVYMASSYTTDDLVSGHEYGWYNDHWRLGMTRSNSAPGADFVIQWNGARRLSLTSGGNLSVTGTISSTNFSGTHSGSSSGTNTGDQTLSGLGGVPTSGYAFGTAFTLGTMYVGTGAQATVTSLLGVYSNGYTYTFGAAAVQSWLGLGSLAYSSATIPTNNNQLTNGAGYITSDSTKLPLAGGIMTGSIVNNTDGAVILESNASENNNWLWKEAAKQWGLFWFNRGTQSGQTIGTYSTVGAELMFMGGSSGIAMPSGWTGYIAGSSIAAMISNWNGYIYSASTIYAATSMIVGGNTVYHTGNIPTWNQNTTGNAATATALSSGQTNWVGTGVLGNVVGMLAWKNYSNSHVIFDASAGTSPSGTAVNQTNSTAAWTAQYPTLMGWNGANTYGVRVDSARISDSTSGNAATATYATTAGSAPNAGNYNTSYGVTAGEGNGLKFWNGSDTYKISMGNGAEYHYGPVTDYSIKTVIDSVGATRGFTWGVNGGTPIAGLNVGNGNMQIAGSFTTTNINAPSGYVSNGNPWGTANSAYFPNGITTAGGENWIYGHTYVGNAPSNGSGHEFNTNGSSYHRSNTATSSQGASARFVELQSANGNFIPYSFESDRGNHSWGTVARYRINTADSDRPSIQFSWGGSDNRWNVGYCYADDNFRITQNMGYRNDNSTSDGWGTERFKIDTSGKTYIGGSLSVGTTYGGFAANIAGTVYVIGGQIYVNDGYQIQNTSGNAIIVFNSSALSFTGAATFNSSINAGGNITGNYILGSYFNSSAGNSENPTIGQIWTQSTGDNYLRKSTPAHFISQLGLVTTSGSISGNAATATRTSGNSGYAHAGTGMYAFYNWGGINGGASAPSNSTYTTGISVGSHPGDQAYGFQIANNMWNTGLWTRNYNSGFGGWIRLLDDSNYNSYAPNLTGTGASGTWGISITGESHGIANNGNAISGMGPISTWDSRPGVGMAGFGISWHTGVSISGYPGYGGVRLYSAGYPTHASSVLRLEASTAVYTYGGLYSDGNPVLVQNTSISYSFGLNDNKLYLRTNNDNNHYLWNNASDFEEMVYYNGTGFKVTSSTGVPTCLFESVNTSGMLFIGSTDAGRTYIGDASRSGIAIGGTAYPQLMLNAVSGGNVTHGANISMTGGLSAGGFRRWVMGIPNLDPTTFSLGWADNQTNPHYGVGVAWGASSAKFSWDTSGNFIATGDITAYGTPSDLRLKDIKEKVPNALESITKLNGYRFDWKEDKSKLFVLKEDVGVIAQEVAEVFPELARTNENGFMSVRYQGLTAVLIEAIKEQQTQIESQKSEIDVLKDLVQQLINR